MDAHRSGTRGRLIRGLLHRAWWVSLLASALALAACNDEDISALPEAHPFACSNTGGNVLVLGQTFSLAGMTAVQGYLAAYGFAGIGTYDNSVATPTLGDLLAYDAVLVWTDGSAFNPTALGDVLADYVDAGGGVAIASFGLSNQSTLLGRILTPAYTPLTPVDNYYLTDSMGDVLLPVHPIMAGVSSLSGYYRDETTPNPGALVLATWSAFGSPVVAVNAARTVVGLSMIPSDTAGNTGDYQRLFANSLHCLADW